MSNTDKLIRVCPVCSSADLQELPDSKYRCWNCHTVSDVAELHPVWYEEWIRGVLL